MPSIYELRDFVGDAAARRFTRRARLRGKARVGFAPGQWQLYQPWPRSHVPFAPEVTVIDDRNDAVWRVMYENWQRRLLFWVDAGDVLGVPREPVLVQLEPGPRALSGDIVTGVEVQPGCLLNQHDSTSSWPDAAQGQGASATAGASLWVHVQGGDWRFDFAGWVPRAAFGTTFAAWDRSLLEANARIRAHADLELHASARASARGGVLGMFRNNRWQHAIRIAGRARRGMVPIRYQGDDFEVTGFLERKHIVVDRNAYSGYGHARDFGKHTVLLHLPEGTCLYADRDGEPVGVCLGESEEVVDRVEDGWWHIPHLWMGWRTFDVWVQDNGPAPAQRTSPGHRILYRDLQRI